MVKYIFYIHLHFLKKKKPPALPKASFLFFISLFNNRRYNCYTSVIFRFGRNFSRPTVYYLFKVGRLSPGSYCHSEPAFCNAVFMESMVSSHLTFVPSTCVVPPVVPA